MQLLQRGKSHSALWAALCQKGQGHRDTALPLGNVFSARVGKRCNRKIIWLAAGRTATLKGLAAKEQGIKSNLEINLSFESSGS